MIHLIPRQIAVLLLLSGTIGLSPALSAPLLLNGSFEDPNVGATGFASGGGTGWSSQSTPGSFLGPGVWADSYLSFARPPAQDGQQVLWIPPGTSVAQSVFLTAGTAYSLGFFATAQLGNSIDTDLRVSITGGGQSIIASFTAVAGSSSWVGHQLMFTAASSAIYSIDFFAKDTWTLQGNAATQYLDNVTLVSVPDSGLTSCMFMFALSGVLTFRRWHTARR